MDNVKPKLSDLEKALQSRSKGESAFLTSDPYRREREKVSQEIQKKIASPPFSQMPMQQQDYNQQGAGAMPAP